MTTFRVMSTDPFTETHPLAKFRARTGLSQAALAERVGCTRWMINRIEVGARRPSINLLQRLAAETGVSTDDILRWQPGTTAEVRP